MRLLIVSDIHGSLYWCKRIIEKFKQINADRLVILGDILYHGARNKLPLEYNPKAVAELLNEYKNVIIAIKGNCDSEVDEMVLEFPLLRNNVLLVNNHNLFLTHGHLYSEANVPFLGEKDILAYGHTHVPFIKEKDGIRIINPGSPSIPKGNSKPSYIIIDQGLIVLEEFEI